MPRQKLIRTKKDCIYKYVDTAGKTKFAYRYKYLDQFKKRKEKTKQGFATEVAAERALIAIKAEVLDGNLKYVENNDFTVAKWMPIFMDSKERVWRTSTYKLYQRNFEKYIKPALGHYKLSALSNMIVQRQLVDSMIDKGCARGYIIIVTRVLLTALNSAVSERIIKYNPVTRLDYGEVGKKAENYFSEEELKTFLNYAHEYDRTTYYTIFLTLALSGMRKGELAGLRWSDINFTDNTITIERTRIDDIVGPPKSDNGYRTINVNQILTKHLQKYKLWVKQELFKRQRILSEDDYVFVDRYNLSTIGNSYVNDALRRILDNCPHDLPKITPHGFRHTFASILIANKIPLVTVAAMIGDHVNTLNNVYAHSLSRVEEETVSLFDNIKLVKTQN